MIQFTDKQNEAMDAIASEKFVFILFGGAMGGGKTFWGLSALLIMCEIFPGSRWCVIREDLEKIRTTTIPSFQKLQASGHLREAPYVYTHPNGSEILFKGENYAKDKEGQWLKGLEVNGFLFEEINECQEQTLDLAFSRAGRWECEPRPKPIILATCNPTQNWVKDRIYNKWKDNDLPPKWLYIPSKVTDNPHLTPEYIELLNNMPRYKYQVFVLGDWDIRLKVGGEFYKCFELDLHVKPAAEIPYNSTLALHVSFDDNSVPYLPCGIFQIAGKEVRMIAEIAFKNPVNKLDKVCAEIERLFPNHNAGIFVYGDATAEKQDTKIEQGMSFFRLIMQYLAKFKPTNRVTKSNPSVVMRGNWLNTVLEKGIGGIKIFISDACPLAINDFIGLKEAPDGTKLKEEATDPITKKKYQKFGHFTDLFDYLMCVAFVSDFVNYQKGDIVKAPVVGRNESKNSY